MYVKLPEPPAPPKPTLPIPSGMTRCSKCRRPLPPSKFESKGRRAGRQVRRTVCDDCRLFRKRVLMPLESERQNETERECKVCGRWWAITMFNRCGDEREYRVWTCPFCLSSQRRWHYRIQRERDGATVIPSFPIAPSWVVVDGAARRKGNT